MEPAGNNKRIAKNTFFLYVRMFVVMCVSLYTSRVILAQLGVTDYGLYGVIGGVVTMFAFLNTSLGSSSSRFITVAIGKGNPENVKKVFGTSMAIHIIMALIILVLCEVIGVWFINEKMIIPPERLYASHVVFQISVVTTLFSITQIPYAASIIAHERMGIYAVIGLLDALAKLLIAFAIAYNPFDRLIWYALLIMLVQISIMIFYRIYCLYHFKECRFQIQKDKKLYKEMLSYSVYDFIGCTSIMAQGQGLNMVLNAFFGPVVNAARAIAYQIQGAIIQFAGGFMTAVTPQIIKQYAQGEVEGMMRLVRRSSTMCFVLMFMIVLPASLEIHYVLKLWLEEYPAYTASFSILVLINTVIDTFRRPRTNCFHATGNIKLSNIITGSILCFSLPLGYILLKLGLNPNYVFVGVIGTSMIADATNLIILRRYINFSILEFLRIVHLRCACHAIVTAIVPICILILMEDSFMRLVVVVISAIIMSALSGLYIALEKHDRDYVLSFVMNRLPWKK